MKNENPVKESLQLFEENRAPLSPGPSQSPRRTGRKQVSCSSLQPRGEGSKKGSVHSRGGFKYSGLKDTARELRQKETEAELIVWKLLRSQIQY